MSDPSYRLVNCLVFIKSEKPQVNRFRSLPEADIETVLRFLEHRQFEGAGIVLDEALARVRLADER